MKITAYEVRPDEEPVIRNLCEKYGIDVVITRANLDDTTVNLAEGSDGITTLGQSTYSNEVLDELKKMGVKVLASRCVGYNHMNVEYAKKLGFKLCNGTYAPNGVAEYSVMAILMCMRHQKKALYNTNDNDFTLKGKMGRDATYVDMDTIYKECDVITIHMPLLPATTGMIDKEAVAKMKDGVIIINNARGELLDVDAIIEGIESEKIGALFCDAFPGETGIIHIPHSTDIIRTEGMPYFKLKYLRSFVNVYHTPHMAFFTEEAAESMAACGVDSIYEILTEGKSSHEIPC